MVTDNERRDVARRLRDSAEERMAVKGTGNGNNWSWLYRSIFGHYMGTKNGAKGHYVEVAHRLADLIEPGMSATPPRRVTDASATVGASQMEQLLALANEMEYDADAENAAKCDPMLGSIARMQVKYANRIREALGEGA